jgi:hypothetical protein
MKRMQHAVFAESVIPSFWACLMNPGGRERKRHKVRQRAEVFINEIWEGDIVSISEHDSTFGAFSVAVWWFQDVPDDAPVIRASEENQNA